MKTTSIVLCLSTLLVAAATASAGDKEKPQKPKPAPAKEQAVTHTEKPAALTGSYIKRVVRQNGLITDGPSQLVVIDRATIERSGARDVRQLLVQQGVGR